MDPVLRNAMIISFAMTALLAMSKPKHAENPLMVAPGVGTQQPQTAVQPPPAPVQPVPAPAMVQQRQPAAPPSRVLVKQSVGDSPVPRSDSQESARLDSTEKGTPASLA